MRRHKWTAAPKRSKGKTKTEERFEAWLYERPEVVTHGFEPLRFAIANGGNYTPDYVVVLEDGTVEIWEVKPSCGWLNESSKVRWKAAAESWAGGLFVFRAAVEKRKKDGGGWDVTTYERRGEWP